MTPSQGRHRTGPTPRSVRPGAEDACSRRRWAAFDRRALELGLPPPGGAFRRRPALARLGDVRRALRVLVPDGAGFDAIFCGSDTLASGVLIEVHALGPGVPDRLSVVGFGDLNFAGDLEPGLTTIGIDAPRIGQLSAGLIGARLRGEEPCSRVIDVGFSIVERQSA